MYTENNVSYYRDGSVLELRISLPDNSHAAALVDEVHFDTNQVELLQNESQIAGTISTDLTSIGWSNALLIKQGAESNLKHIRLLSDSSTITESVTEAVVARIYFKIREGVETDAGTPITFTFPAFEASDADFQYLTPGFDPSDVKGTYKTECTPVTIIAKTPSVNFSVSNGFITQSQAKAINSANDLKNYNSVVGELGDGTPLTITSSCPQLAALKAGTLGTYEVTYSYSGNGLAGDSQTVSLTVVEDNVELSEDGTSALNATDKIITVAEAKSLLAQNDLIGLNNATVKKADGSSDAPVVNCSQFTQIQAGTVGAYPVIYSYGEGKSYVAKTVNITIVPDGSAIAPDGTFAISAKEGFIKQSAAKVLNNKAAVREYNAATVYLSDGSQAIPTTSIGNAHWTEIKAGAKGTYNVFYSYGSGANEAEVTVSLTVIGDEDDISNSGKYSLSADDLELTVEDAKKISSEDALAGLANAIVTEVDGSTFAPNISAPDFEDIKNGVIGDYEITFSYGEGDDYVEKKIIISVVKDKVNEIDAANNTITASAAKNLSNKEALISVNGVTVTAIDGSHPAPVVSAPDFLKIKAGIVGSYSITYSYGTGDKKVEKTVVVNVVADGSEFDEDGSLSAKDAIITVSEAEKLTTKKEIAVFNEASVRLHDGSQPEPTIIITTNDWADLKSGTIGTYNVAYTYTTGSSTLRKDVTITVVPNDSDISDDKTVSLTAKDAIITSTDAKKLNNKNTLISLNEAKVVLADGSEEQPIVNVSSDNWLSIREGKEGNYTVLYEYGTNDKNVEKQVKITVVNDNSVISKDGTTSLVANDGEISTDEVMNITSPEDLIDFNEAEVVFADGSTAKPEVGLSTKDLNDIKNGVEGDYTIIYSYGNEGDPDYVEKSVIITVVQKTKDVLLFDYDESGFVGSNDKSQFNSFLLNPTTCNEVQFLLSDGNGDGVIGSSDKLMINYYLLNPTEMPPIVKVPVYK